MNIIVLEGLEWISWVGVHCIYLIEQRLNMNIIVLEGLKWISWVGVHCIYLSRNISKDKSIG